MVNPNDDGSYTSPGEGWIAFIPTKKNPWLLVPRADGLGSYKLGENADGSPANGGTLWTGRVADASWDIIGFYLTSKAFTAVTNAAWGAWVAHRTEQATALGRKLDYIFGKATGSAHNIQRSTSMLRQLERIGLGDSQAARKYLAEHLSKVAGDATNVVARQANGRVVRESLLMGPRGALKVESIWEGGKLITVKLIGGGN